MKNIPDYSQGEIKLLKDNVSDIIVDNSQDGTGFAVVLAMKDGHGEFYPGTMSLAEALECSQTLGNLIGLSNEHIMTRVAAVQQNRLSDLEAFKMSKAIKDGTLAICSLNFKN